MDTDVIEDLQGFVEQNLALLTPVEQAWQPSDFLPNLMGDDWAEELSQFRSRALALPDDLLVILVGNMITEEALPNYAVSLTQIAKAANSVGNTAWCSWLRGWTAEENRHGDLLNAYLRLTGRVDIRSVEVTIHHLIKNGFSSRSHNDHYGGLIYASFQERATRITHGNVSKLASQYGEENLARICRRIAGDEARHETFYTRVVGEVLDRDPEGGILSFRAMLKGNIAMPGSRMFDGKDPNLFDHFATVAQRRGVYTVQTYSEIIGHLVDTWEIATRSVSGKAAKAQEYLCRQAERYRFFADEIAAGLLTQPLHEFSWVTGSMA